MARTEFKYFYRACFKPNHLDVFKEFHSEINNRGMALGYAQVWHKANVKDESPYSVPNEFICGEIGRFLRLPIPPFAITHANDGHLTLFSSLDFNFSRAKLPPIDPESCVEKLAPLCTGVLLFDILIANEDRHDENILVDNVAKPKQMHVYDQNQALFGGTLTVGRKRFKKLRDRLGITGSSVTGGNPHVFLDVLNTTEFFGEWFNRIHAIPEWFVKDVCNFANVELALTKEEADDAADFIIHRRSTIEDIVFRNRSEFTAISDWGDEGTLL